ncbi:MAG: DNA-protecting protein DprA, partial [Anaerolineae bacterium]|nr:DNA-protecting protein DprA [Anaerolineae bacterium]
MAEVKYWVGFNIVHGIGPMKFRALLNHFGDLEEAWHADARELKEAGLDQRALGNFMTTRSTISLDREMEKIERQGARVLTWDDPAYPPRLLNIYNPPPVLYVKGEILEEDQWAVAVVGTRGATVYGKEVTRRIAGGLARNGLTIVSGLARGIDSEAHRAALDAGGRT